MASAHIDEHKCELKNYEEIWNQIKSSKTAITQTMMMKNENLIHFRWWFTIEKNIINVYGNNSC